MHLFWDFCYHLFFQTLFILQCKSAKRKRKCKTNQRYLQQMYIFFFFKSTLFCSAKVQNAKQSAKNILKNKRFLQQMDDYFFQIHFILQCKSANCKTECKLQNKVQTTKQSANCKAKCKLQNKVQTVFNYKISQADE